MSPFSLVAQAHDNLSRWSIAQVKEAKKRILVMEYIQGGRVDDLVYLSENNIDRNKVALDLARIFCQMVHINGWFHADPHPGAPNVSSLRLWQLTGASMSRQPAHPTSWP